MNGLVWTPNANETVHIHNQEKINIINLSTTEKGFTMFQRIASISATSSLRMSGAKSIQQHLVHHHQQSKQSLFVKSFSSLASDVSVSFTLIDVYGNRHIGVGRVGESLSSASKNAGLGEVLQCDASDGGLIKQRINSERWTEDLFGEGPQSAQSHVVVARDWAGKLPQPNWQEIALLKEVDEDDVEQNSRLACQIILTKDLDGIVVHVPDAKPPLDT